MIQLSMPEHRFHEQPTIERRSAGIDALARRMWFHPIPLMIFQNRTTSVHPSLRFQKELESDLRVRRKPESHRALARLWPFLTGDVGARAAKRTMR